MKVLLVHAYFLDLDEAERRVMKPYPPLGVLYLSATVKAAGHEVEVFDGTFCRPEDFRATVEAFDPEVVGFYATMMSRRHVLALRRQLAGREVLVVVGGPDPPHYDEDYLDAGFDVVVRGEGEGPLIELLGCPGSPAAWSAIAGLSFRRDGVTVRTPAATVAEPLDRFPFPDRGAIDLEAYLACWERHHGQRPVSLITARGCPYHCTWCSHSVYGHTLRKRSPENVLAELEEINRRYRVSHYWFADDVFTVVYDWVLEFRDLLLAHPGLIRPFETISRANRLSDEMIRALADLRCHRLWVGAESGSQRLLDAMRRGVRREQVIAAARALHGAGIAVGMFFMWGFGDERLEDVLDTVDLAARCRPEVALTTIAYPIKGTDYHRGLAEAARLASPADFASSTDRDTRTLGQPGREVYRWADRLLHHRLAASRARDGSLLGALKGLRHDLEAWRDRRALERAWPGSKTASSVPSAAEEMA